MQAPGRVVVSIAVLMASAGFAGAQCGPQFPDVAFNDGLAGAPDVAFGDVNGDGEMDIVGCLVEAGAIVHFGNGDGTFGPGTEYAMGGSPLAVSLGDLDGDGTLDLVVAGFDIDSCDPYYDPDCYYYRGGGVSYINNGVFYRLNNGDGTFGPVSTLSTMFDPQDVTLGDFDGDGDLDISCVEFDSFFSTKVWFNDGTASFGPPDEYSTNVGGTAIDSGDMNGDGSVDIVITRSFSHVAEVLLNTGSGTMAAPVSYALSSIRPEGVDLGDADGDGDLDVAVSIDSGSRVDVFMNNGSGVLTTSQVLNASNDPQGVLFADIDDDSDLDVLVATGNGTAVEIFENVGGGTYSTSERMLVGGAVAIDVADVNGDGLLDVGMGNNSFGGGIVVRLNVPAGIVSRQDEYLPVSDPNKISLFDFDNDGDQDIAVGRISSLSPNVVVMVNAGDGTYPTQIDLFTETTPFPATGDVNGDGFADIVTSNLSGNSMSVFFNNTVGGFNAPVKTEYGGAPRASVLADMNGDGHLDHLTQLSAADLVVMMLNDGSGAFTTRVDIPVADTPSQLEVADVDDDGDNDILVTRRDADSVAVLLNNGDGTFPPPVSYPVDEDPISIDVADFDGDGDLDFVTLNISIGSGDVPDTLSVRFNNGSGVFSGTQDLTAGRGAENVHAGDADSDGDVDLVSSNRGELTFSVLTNTDGSGTSWSSISYAESRGPRWAETADINEDGVADLVIAQASGFVSVNYGEPCGNAPCPADLAPPMGVLNFFDVAAYIGLYNAGDPGADLAAPFGTLNFFDVAAFIAAYNAGCP